MTTMAKARILVVHRLPAEVEARLSRDFAAELNTEDRVISALELIPRARDFDALLISSMFKCRADVINALPPTIRMIATFSVGTDHIDIPAARARNIAVSNTPDVLTDATADISLLLMLGAARGASWGDRMVRESKWPPPSLVAPLGLDVSGRRLGILGMGRIGQAVARRARAFNMKLHYHNRKRVDASLEHGAMFHSRFEDMLPHCDFLSINCASTAETRGIVNTNTLSLLPPDAIVVNAARGDIVDDDALISALKSGKLAAAGLDVFKGEPNIDPRYRELENIFMLPHLGSATKNTRIAMGMRAVDNLEAFFKAEKPRDLLTGA
jgi:lactate dehydrogenase-like 2-hydroxyacid dehydrogenase